MPRSVASTIRGACSWRSPATSATWALAAGLEGEGDGFRAPGGGGLKKLYRAPRIIRARPGRPHALDQPPGIIDETLSTRRNKIVLTVPAYAALTASA
jgi:hypothetical protein